MVWPMKNTERVRRGVAEKENETAPQKSVKQLIEKIKKAAKCLNHDFNPARVAQDPPGLIARWWMMRSSSRYLSDW